MTALKISTRNFAADVSPRIKCFYTRAALSVALVSAAFSSLFHPRGIAVAERGQHSASIYGRESSGCPPVPKGTTWPTPERKHVNRSVPGGLVLPYVFPSTVRQETGRTQKSCCPARLIDRQKGHRARYRITRLDIECSPRSRFPRLPATVKSFLNPGPPAAGYGLTQITVIQRFVHGRLLLFPRLCSERTNQVFVEIYLIEL